MMVETPVAPARWQQAIIERITPRTPRVISVFLRAPLQPHVAGQHVDVRLTADDGYEAERSGTARVRRNARCAVNRARCAARIAPCRG